MEIPTERIDAIFGDWDRASSPGCALGVIQNGQIAYSRGYGMSNLERVAVPEPGNEPACDGGDFYSAELDSTYRLESAGDTLVMTHYRLEDRTLQHAFGDVFAANNLCIELERDTDDNVTGFRASTFQVCDMRFERK